MVDLIEATTGARIVGKENFDEEKHGWPLSRYLGLGTLLDCRGDLTIHPTVTFGYNVTILTASHLYNEKGLGRRFLRKVRIDEHAWIATRALLYNCWIQEHAIVAAGAVVKNAIVPAWSLVDGNPAAVIGRWNAEKCRYVKFGTHIEELEKF